MNPPPDESPTTDLYAVPVSKRWLLFSPRTWTAAVVNRCAAAAIALYTEEGDDTLSDDLRRLWTRLTCSTGLGTAPVDEAEKLVIIPTRSCNMRCVYCDFAAADAPRTTLDPRLACALVDYFAERLRARGHDMLRVHFFGGEPLVARRCTEAVVHYVRSLCARTGAMPWFELTTNGLFDPHVVPFVGDYIDSVVVSLDGTEALHDYNRRRRDGGGTYAEIAANIRRLADYPVELCLRMCVTNRSVGVMADLAERYCAEFDFDVLSFEMLAENDSAREFGMNAPDPYQFAVGVLEAEAVGSRQGVRIVHGPSELVGPRTTCCPLGRGTLMLTPSGQLTACYLDPQRWTERGLDLVLGHVDVATGVSVDDHRVETVASVVRSKPRCARCFCRHTCAGGCHVDQTPPGCSLDYDDRCRAIRLITAARLLRSLGCHEDADSLMAGVPAMQSLADHPDDRLASWNVAAAGRQR